VRTSLALRHGVLWIARSVKVTRLAPFDVNGRRLGPGFTMHGIDRAGTEVRGIAVDEDHRVWAADAASGSLRAFTAFGAEITALRSLQDPESDRPEAFGDPGGIASQGVEADARLLLSRRGERRHALLLVDPARGTSSSLRAGGDAQGSFSNLAGVALSERLAFACETGKKSVQVFRDGEFHYRISMPAPRRGVSSLEPCSVAALRDGRAVVACRGGEGGAVLLFDPGGSLVRCIAVGRADGTVETGDVEGPSAVAVQEGASDRTSLVLVLDRDGDRVQAFSLDGACLGSFHDLEFGARSEGSGGRQTSSGPG
jgi:hypothetical protein